MAVIITIRGVRRTDERAAREIATDSVATFASKDAAISVVFLPAEVTGISVSIAKNGTNLQQHQAQLAQRIRGDLGHLDPEPVSVVSNIWPQGWKPNAISVKFSKDPAENCPQFHYVPTVSEAAVKAVFG